MERLNSQSTNTIGSLTWIFSVFSLKDKLSAHHQQGNIDFYTIRVQFLIFSEDGDSIGRHDIHVLFRAERGSPNPEGG